MTFAAPWMLLGLVVLPWLVWLERRRERPARVAVSSLLLFEDADAVSGRSVPSWRWLRIVLLASMWTASVVAAAGPGIASGEAEGRRFGLVLDRSASMRTAIEDGLSRTRADDARESVRRWLDSLRKSDRVSLRRVPGPDEVSPWLTPGAARDAIESHGVGDAPGRPSALDVTRFFDRGGERSVEVVVVTDDSRDVRNSDAAVIAVGGRVENSAIRSLVADVAIDADDDEPDADESIRVRRFVAGVRHFGDRARDATLVLAVDGRDVDRRDVRLEPDTLAIVVFDDGAVVRATASVRLAEPDALASDDRFVIARSPWRPLRISIGAEVAAPIVRALRLDPRVEIVGGSASADVVIASGVPIDRAAARFRVVIDPTSDVDEISVGEVVRPLRLVATSAPAMDGVVLDGVRVDEVRQLRVPNDTTVLASAILENGEATPVIVRRGELLVVAFALERTDWWLQPGFPIFWHERVTEWGGRRALLGLSSRATGDRVVFGFAGSLGRDADPAGLTFAADTEVLLERAGLYTVRSEADGTTFAAAVNLESDDESSGRVHAVSTDENRDPETELRPQSVRENGVGRALLAAGLALLAIFYARYRD